jgi:hypothetical protein
MKIPILQILLVVSLICPMLAVAAPGGDSKDLAAEVAALRAQVAQLSHQVQRSQDYIDICNLQDAYGFYVDKAKWDEVADLFTKDGTLEIGLRGVYKGARPCPRLSPQAARPHLRIGFQPHSVAAHGHRQSRWQDRQGTLARVHAGGPTP